MILVDAKQKLSDARDYIKNADSFTIALGAVAASCLAYKLFFQGENTLTQDTPAIGISSHNLVQKPTIMASSSSMSAPHIKSISWGKLVITDKGKDTVYKDAKVWSSQAKAWNWKATGTEHVPGIQIADIEEFIKDVDEVILTRGMHLVLQVPQETIKFVTDKGKKCHVGQTEEMVQLYNTLVSQGKKVGGVFHSTC